ncbi:MAG: LuxR C-terminal-related transcriptional regulator [Desulfobacter sp.]
MGKKQKERRAFERFSLEVPARLTLDREDGGSETSEFSTENISAGGALIRTDHPLDMGTCVDVRLTLPLDRLRKLDGRSVEVRLSGRVIRSAESGTVIGFDSNMAVGSAGNGEVLSGPDTGLTRRENQILNLIASGASNKDIADALEIGLATVKSHIYSLYKKIGVKNRFQAILWRTNRLE